MSKIIKVPELAKKRIKTLVQNVRMAQGILNTCISSIADCIGIEEKTKVSVTEDFDFELTPEAKEPSNGNRIANLKSKSKEAENAKTSN